MEQSINDSRGHQSLIAARYKEFSTYLIIVAISGGFRGG